MNRKKITSFSFQNDDQGERMEVQPKGGGRERQKLKLTRKHWTILCFEFRFNSQFSILCRFYHCNNNLVLTQFRWLAYLSGLFCAGFSVRAFLSHAAKWLPVHRHVFKCLCWIWIVNVYRIPNTMYVFSSYGFLLLVFLIVIVIVRYSTEILVAMY